MSRRYDSRTTTFSPEGRLYQVEYALEAINNASSTLGILATDGVVLAADKMVSSKLLDHGRAKEKLYKVENHVMCAVAGLTADANILINQARVNAQRFLYQYGEPQPIEQLVVQLCDVKQVRAISNCLSLNSRLAVPLRRIQGGRHDCCCHARIVDSNL